MSVPYNPRYPSVEDLRDRAKKRIPRFVFEFLDGGCNENINLHKNTSEIREVELKPFYVGQKKESELTTELLVTRTTRHSALHRSVCRD